MQQISKDMYEAAARDGAGWWPQVRHITVPLLNRQTVLILVLQVIASLQLFGQTYLLTSGGPAFSTRPVIEYIYDTGFTSFRVGFAAATSYLFFILILFISLGQFWFLSRQGRNSLWQHRAQQSPVRTRQRVPTTPTWAAGLAKGPSMSSSPSWRSSG